MLIYSNEGARPLKDVAGDLMLSSEKPLDFHVEICPELLICIEYL